MRIGNITSSEIVALTTNGKTKDSFGKPFYTYVQQCKWERMLGRSLETESNARPLTWGKLCEIYYFQNKGLLHYTPLMDEPIKHEEVDCWLGSPDAINNKIDAVTELKSPYTLTSFCQLVEPIMLGLTGMDAMNHIRDNHKDGDKYFWQCVSNAILTKKKTVEFVVFCPMKSELNDLRQLAQSMPPEVLRNYWWIDNATDEELPHLIEDCKYQSINSIIFEPPQSDIDFLTSRVKAAGAMFG